MRWEVQVAILMSLTKDVSSLDGAIYFEYGLIVSLNQNSPIEKNPVQQYIRHFFFC
jgi:hypothetical protein